jgi:hypothetical protein
MPVWAEFVAMFPEIDVHLDLVDLQVPSSLPKAAEASALRSHLERRSYTKFY